VSTTGTLLLRMGGPTQAWHVHRSRSIKFSNASRYSPDDLAPTRSGVLGLLAGAQGRPRDDDMGDLLDLDMAVRTDQRGRVRGEFKTSRRRNPAGRLIPEIKREVVLDDACFLVGVAGPRRLLDDLYAACQEPAWAPYYGQLAYPVTLPLELDVVDDDLETAMRAHPWMAADHYRRQQGRRVHLRLAQSAWVGGITDDVTELYPVIVDNPTGRAEPDFMAALR
jgi:CRISPR system Cascade subunit CasD